MKIALSAIGKLENQYIREWVEYNKLIGFDKIFLYDNNDPWGEYFDIEIKDYIDSGFVQIIDYRGKKICQCESYQETLDKYYKDYDYICFFDCDEFLTFTKGDIKTVKDYLNKNELKQFDVIKINFLAYGDNDLLENNSKGVLGVFKNPLDVKCLGPLDYPNNLHTKTIIKCSCYNGKNIKWTDEINTNGRNGDPHSPKFYGDITCCNNCGQQINPNLTISNINYDLALLRHYSTKTIKEFVLNKFRRGFPDQICNYKISDYIKNIGTFFSFNRTSNQKLDLLGQLTKELYEDKNDIVISEARGRIGNTLFTIAAGLYYAEKYNLKYYLYINREMAQYIKTFKNGNKVYYTDWIISNDIFKNINRINNLDILNNATITCYEKYSNKYQLIPYLENTNIYINGFRQSPKYFERKWCQEKFEPSKKILDIIYKYIKDNFNINNLDNIVCINIRRGDYTNPVNNWILYVNPIDWFKKVINIYNKEQKFLIVSDDISWCKENFKDIENKIYYFDYQEDDKDFIDLYVQTLCKDNIISNSTFSWWGAYLNIHENRKVYYHSPWFVNEQKDGDIIPENDNWIDIQ